MMICGHTIEKTPMPATNYWALNDPIETPAEKLVRQCLEATLHQTVVIQRIYWLIWGVIVPPVITAFAWFLFDLIA